MMFRQAVLDGPPQPIEPWPSIAIREGNTSLEFSAILPPEKIIGIVKRPAKRFRQSSPDPRFP